MWCGNKGRYNVPYAVIRLLLDQGQFDQKMVKPVVDIIRRANRDRPYYWLEEAGKNEPVSEYYASYQSISNTGMCRFTMRDGALCMEMTDKATEILQDNDGIIIKRFGRHYPEWTATRATGRIHTVY